MSNAIKMAGVVTVAHNSTEFDVKLENGIVIKSSVSGKIRVHHIRILPGDKVDVEISPYDLSRGRIVYRQR